MGHVRKRRLAASLLILVAFSAVAIGRTASVLGATPTGCAQAPVSGFDGFADETTAGGSRWEGASAYIVTRKSANVCNASDEDSSAWVMIGDPWTDCSDPIRGNYAQTGYITTDDGPGSVPELHSLAAFSDCNNGQKSWISSNVIPAGQKHAYRAFI